jgi:hypothetical protein
MKNMKKRSDSELVEEYLVGMGPDKSIFQDGLFCMKRVSSSFYVLQFTV